MCVVPFQRQWDLNGGDCGICGDPVDGERHNEAGGTYAKGIISRTYQEEDVITVTVTITAHHKGWFEFRACPNNDVNTPATQQCLDSYLLPLADGSGTRFDIPPPITGDQDVLVELRLPKGLKCTQCVFQWKWNTGKLSNIIQ